MSLTDLTDFMDFIYQNSAIWVAGGRCSGAIFQPPKTPRTSIALRIIYFIRFIFYLYSFSIIYPIVPKSIAYPLLTHYGWH